MEEGLQFVKLLIKVVDMGNSGCWWGKQGREWMKDVIKSRSDGRGNGNRVGGCGDGGGRDKGGGGLVRGCCADVVGQDIAGCGCNRWWKGNFFGREW